MFSAKELNIDSQYFEIIGLSALCVTIRSRNTGHFWHIVNADLNNHRSCRIYHRHQDYGSYHLHGHKRTLKLCLKDIQEHDAFQLNGRRPVKKQKKREIPPDHTDRTSHQVR